MAPGLAIDAGSMPSPSKKLRPTLRPEPLLQDNPNRFTMFPISEPDVWRLYKQVALCAGLLIEAVCFVDAASIALLTRLSSRVVHRQRHPSGLASNLALPSALYASFAFACCACGRCNGSLDARLLPATRLLISRCMFAALHAVNGRSAARVADMVHLLAAPTGLRHT